MLCERGSDKGGRGSKNVTHFCDITYGWSLSLYDRRKPRSSCGGAEALPSAPFGLLPPSLSIWPYLNATLLEGRCYSDVMKKQESEDWKKNLPQSKVYVIASMCLIVI